MEINVLNKNFEKIAIVDGFTSLMWCKRYYDIGALDLEIEATTETLATFKRGYYITRDDDDAIFRIEAIELDTTTEEGNSLIIGAVDCKSILNQRIIWDQVNWGAGTAEDFIRYLVLYNVVNVPFARKILNFEMQPKKGFTETIEQQVTYDQLGDKIIEVCQTFGYGWKILFFNNAFHFDLYKGVDRSMNQNENSKVIFSPEYENIVSSKYNEDITDFKNVALVGGEGEGVERKKRTVGTATGLDRYEMFVDASGISRNEGTEEEIDLVDYYEALINEGKEKLLEHGVITSFEGEVDYNSYQYKTDYNLGDIVTVRNEYGISVNARITEIIETWDDEGYSVEPKFEYFEPMELEAPVQGALLTENSVMLLSETATPLLAENAPAEANGLKISELPTATELYDGSCFPIVQNGVTKRVTKATLQKQILPANPRFETADGIIFDSGHDTVKGLGRAIVELHNGIARVEFDVLITEYSTTSSTTIADIGINRDLLVSLNNRIPLINPGNGICTFFKPNGEFNILEGYGGVMMGRENYWRVGRRYTTNNDFGMWPAHQFNTSQVINLRIKGVCYGTYDTGTMLTQ